MSTASDSVERTERKETDCRNTPQRKLLCRSGRTGLAGAGDRFDSGNEWGAWVGGDFACRERI